MTSEIDITLLPCILLPPGSIDLHIGMLAFRLMLSNPVGGVILGTRAECRVLIVPGSKMKHKV